MILTNDSFPKTEWTLVSAAGKSEMPANRAALESVLVRYLPVLKAHVVMQYRVSEDQAADWLQSFVLKKVLEKNLIAHADQNRGKFRSFLIRALHNFIIQQIRRAQTEKRCPAGAMMPLDEVSERDMTQVDDPRIEGFDVAWARGILAETIQRMEKQCAESGRADVWGVFECRILKPIFEDVEPLPYEKLVARFNLQSPAHASNFLITAKRMFSRFLRSVVAEYARDAREVEEEIQELKAILFRS
jgi:DNA-directed RNA polymerase specialized sigma24 family protein